ncbi:dihydroxyacetone kinase subunit DhaL [Mycoplasma todarodis]|uniref:Dihydroxyacetone kinase subunit L n=1 Tax=Mycoplasma todarodis TaxID=1937191 RepID=A0A4R0XSS6_9MOLU|nr:dihydroxyacetone kinase subunit DhaL [Mycoplasma todarodis]TCG10777.1 dihydroxyacetone kinase subunit L [Mycoplasma todarodis]
MAKKALEIFTEINKELLEKEKFLTDLDNKIGDGDHGFNMKRGFGFVMEALEQKPDIELKEALALTGKILMSKVGGASGPLYGMSFIKGSKNLETSDLNYKNLAKFVKGASDAVELLGKSHIGDATLYDVWRNLSNDMEKSIPKEELIENIIKYRDATKEMMALRGRASFLKERSIGTIDPGCASSEIILRHFLEEL